MKSILLFFFILMSGLMALQGCQESTATPSFSLAAEPVSPSIDPYVQSFIKEYDRYFTDSMLTGQTPGAAVVIVKDSQIVFRKGYGEKVLGSYDPVDVHTLFRIGSLSKGFAGVLTGILVDEGYLHWEDPVRKYLPDFRLQDEEQARNLQVRHLLSHTTGLPYHAYDNLIEQGYNLEAILNDYLPQVKLHGQAGQFFSYQNAAFNVIEPVLEAATGKTYQSLLKAYILDPAGMDQSSLDYQSMRTNSKKALPHIRLKDGWQADTVTTRYYGFTAAGGVNSSVSDMGKWLTVLLGHRTDIVSDSMLDVIFHPFVATGLERRTLPGWIERDSAFYGMGWRILFTGNDTLQYHAGMVNNYYSEIALSRRDGIGICVLFNGASPLRGRCIREFFERWKAGNIDNRSCEDQEAKSKDHNPGAEDQAN